MNLKSAFRGIVEVGVQQVFPNDRMTCPFASRITEVVHARSNIPPKDSSGVWWCVVSPAASAPVVVAESKS